MGISLLSKVTIITAKSELEEILMRLFEFEAFHPSEETPFYEDFRIIKLKSRALELYIELNNIIESIKTYAPSEKKITLESTNWTDLLDKIEYKKDEIKAKLLYQKLHDADIQELVALREAASVTFNALRRVRIKHELKYIVSIEGYIPTKSEERFKEEFSKWCYCIQSIGKDERAPYVPTLLVNPKFIQLFEKITLAQGIPKYREIDPTPFIAFVFPLFYGIMFADLGQGILLLIFGKIISMQRNRTYRYWGKMMMAFGISASIGGIVTGSFFGLDIGAVLLLPSIRIVEAGIININMVLTIVSISVIIGTYHLALAYFIAMINKIRMRDYADAFTNHLATLIMYAFSILLALSFMGANYNYNNLFTTNAPLPVISYLNLNIPSSYFAILSLPIVIASVITIIFGRAIASLSTHGFGKALIEGLNDIIFKPIEFLANTISYSRLGILLVVHSVLMDLVNSAWSYGLSALPLVIIGNIVVMALEGFLVYIQDLRLHLYEWFTKFHEGGATLFTFLKPETDFVEIVFRME